MLGVLHGNLVFAADGGCAVAERPGCPQYRATVSDGQRCFWRFGALTHCFCFSPSQTERSVKLEGVITLRQQLANRNTTETRPQFPVLPGGTAVRSGQPCPQRPMGTFWTQ